MRVHRSTRPGEGPEDPQRGRNHCLGLLIRGDFGQSTKTRPISTAMFAPVYTDDVRRSIQQPPSSPSWTLEPLKRGSQLSYVKKYSEVIGKFPRFWSQGSLGSSRRFESARSLMGSEEYQDLVDKTEADPPRRRAGSEGFNSRARSRSLTHAGSQDGSPRDCADVGAAFYGERWRTWGVTWHLYEGNRSSWV